MLKFLGGTTMAWSKPIIREIECGMEINMYGPDGDRDDSDGVLY
jgi:coenzyme PQQ precursor peptide PqqA